MRVLWSDHALARIRLRALDPEWVERVLTKPEVVEPDPNHSGRLRAYGAIPERDGKIMRVVYEPTPDGGEVVIVTALLDRGRMRRRGQTS